MLTWNTILAGAGLTAAAAAALVTALIRPRTVSVVATVAAPAFVGPLTWNAILHTVGGSDFFVDAPIAVLPASWQDTGSGVFTVAASSIILGASFMADRPGRLLAYTSMLCGLTAFLVDVYLY